MPWNAVPTRSAGHGFSKARAFPSLHLFENLESGASIDQFVEWFPGVTQEQAQAVLIHTEQSLLTA